MRTQKEIIVTDMDTHMHFIKASIKELEKLISLRDDVAYAEDEIRVLKEKIRQNTTLAHIYSRDVKKLERVKIAQKDARERRKIQTKIDGHKHVFWNLVKVVKAQKQEIKEKEEKIRELEKQILDCCEDNQIVRMKDFISRLKEDVKKYEKILTKENKYNIPQTSTEEVVTEESEN